MKNPTLLITITALAATLQTVSAQVLFTTTNDFSGWSGNAGSTVGSTTDFDYDGSTVNGAGNLSNPGGVGGGGSLSVQWAGGVGNFNPIAVAPYEGANQGFMSIIDPGQSVAGNTMAAYSGTLNLVYTLPDNEGGNYFQLGILLQYAADSYYQQFFPAGSDTFLGTIDGFDTYKATIPYTITAGAESGFGFSIIYNSNYSPLEPFYVDQISVAVVPEPTTISLLASGVSVLALYARRRRA